MTIIQPKQHYEIGLIDLFFMGRILVPNLVKHRFVVRGYNEGMVLRKESDERNFRSAANIIGCIRLLRKPSSMMMLCPPALRQIR
jgi:6-phosphogluconate dehydrogenase